MNNTIPVDLHCHSSHSDGALPPELIAPRFVQAGIQYASLTDHNTLDGQAVFRAECRRLGVGCVTGIELTTYLDTRPVHILGYGFDPENEELLALLPLLRPPPNVASSNFPAQRELSCAEGIALIHRAGGLAFMAHPFITEPDADKCVQLVETLLECGLDGIELFRSDDPPALAERLRGVVGAKGALLCAGTDSHFNADPPGSRPGTEMPVHAWKSFRAALFAASKKYDATVRPVVTKGTPGLGADVAPPRSFIRHVVFPAILALCLFAGVVLFVVLPAFEQALLDRKREMIRELTNTAWSVLAEAQQEEQQGVLTTDEARAQAIKRVGAMRYGQDAKDYFWIQDTLPRMVMHPYRTDLVGSDLSGFTDPRGVRIFVVFSDLARTRREGYVNYVWQWKDDPTRLEPKESYIRLFEPWGWIIGTGLYTHDVQAEVNRLTMRLMLFSAGIFGVVAFLLVYVLRSTLRIERKRSHAEASLRETTDRYKTLVNAATEGMLLCNGRRCVYGNSMVLGLTGYRQEDFELMDVSDLVPDVPENAAISAHIRNRKQGFPTTPIPGVIQGVSGAPLECAITLQPAGPQPTDGYLLLLRRSATIATVAAAHPPGFPGNLLKLPASIAQDIREDIDRAVDADAVAELCLGAGKLVRSLLDNGASVLETARMLSLITDAATRRFAGIAIGMIGEPPVPFAFIALGSQGRQEQTLLTDQDNAIIYHAQNDTERLAAAGYFQKLADFICAGLGASGYRHCKGKVMASNPRWCQPLQAWKDDFSLWIQRADLRELMEFSIFFDFRLIDGDEALVRELREHVCYRVAHSPRFFPQAAQNALQFKSPMRLFGMVVSAPGKGESANQIDLKAASMPIIGFARLYALQQGIVETNTGARIDELVRRGGLLPSRQEEIMTAYSLLLRLRLRHQMAIIESGGEPDNKVDPSTLGHIERAILRECFNEIDVLQTKIRGDFLGGT